MALNIGDRVQETSTSTGTGTITLAGAVTGFQSFAVVGNANTTYYTIADQAGSNWEVGIGTYYLANTSLARTTILASSNSNAAVTFGAGVKNVFVTYPAEKAIYADSNDVTTITNIASANAVITGGTINNTSFNNVSVVSANITTANVTTQLNLTNASDYNLYASGAGANYLAGSLGIGTTPTTTTNRLIVAGAGLTAASFQTIDNQTYAPSTATGTAVNYRSVMGTAAAAFTLANMQHFATSSAALGASSAVTNQSGYLADSTLNTATNNYGFRGSIAAATGAFNLYMSGTANNYLAGQLLVGTTTATVGYTALSPTQSANQYQVSIGGTNTFAGTPYGLLINTALTGTTATTSAVGMYVNNIFAVPASGTIVNIIGIQAQPNFNTTSTVTTFSGVYSTIQFGASAIGNTLTNAYSYNAISPNINASTTTAITTAAQFNAANIAGTAGSAITTAVAFYGRQAASNTGVTNNYNLYMSGTASNYLAGSLGIGTPNLTGYGIRLNKAITGAVTSYGMRTDGAVQSDVTSGAAYFSTLISTQAAAFTLPALYHYFASQSTIGASSAVTSQSGFQVDNTFTGATNNFAFYGQIAAATGAYNLYMAGTAANYMAGGLNIGATTDPGAGNLSVTGSITGGALSVTSNAVGSVNAKAGGKTSVTAVAGSLTLATGGVTLASQVMAASSTWRVVAYGTYAASSSATARTLTMACYWGSTALTSVTTGNVLASTAQTTPWKVEIEITGSSATAAWITGILTAQVTSATIPLNYTATAASVTSLTTTSTLDFRVGQTGTAVAGDTINVQSVTIERIV